MQVIEEHFYINDEEFLVPANNDFVRVNCFEEFVLPAGKTLDFAASFSGWHKEHEKFGMSAFVLELHQDDEVVARNRDTSGVHEFWFTHNAHLIFTEKNISDEDQPYKLCIGTYKHIEELIVYENLFQWGYKILGEGYNVTEHKYDGSALTMVEY